MNAHDQAVAEAAQPWQGHRPGTRGYRRLIVGLFFAGVATFAQLYATQALLPQLSEAFGSTPSQAALTVSAATFGVAASVLPWSILADRIGRRRAMTFSVSTATALALIGLAAADLNLLITIRFLEGVALGGVPAAAVAFIAEEVQPRLRLLATASYISGTAIGGLSGRMVVGVVAQLAGDWRTGILAVLLVCAGAVAVFVLVTPAARMSPRNAAASAGGRLLSALRNPRLLVLYLQGFVLMGVFASSFNYLSFHLSAPPHLLGSGAISLLFMSYLAGSVASSGAGRLAQRRSSLSVLIGAEAVVALGILGLLSGNLALILPALLLVVTGFFGAHAIATGWVAHESGAHRAQASAYYILAYYLGAGVLGWLTGLVYEGAGWGPFVCGLISLLMLGSAAAILTLRREDAG